MYRIRTLVLGFVLFSSLCLNAPKAEAIVWLTCLFDACDIFFGGATELGDSDPHPHPPLVPGFHCEGREAYVLLTQGPPPTYQRYPSFDAFCQRR